MKTILDRGNFVFNPPQLGCVLSLTGLPGGSNKIHDTGPYGNLGTITGATWVRLPSGLWCLSFDGSDDYADCGNNASLDVTGGITIEAWVRYDGNLPFSSWDNIVWKGYTSAAPPYSQYWLGCHSGQSYFRAGVTVGGVAKDVSMVNDPILAGLFYHYALTWDGTLRLYLNGAETATLACAGSLSTYGTNLYLGKNNLFSGREWQGLIVLPRIYSLALSALEIKNHFDQEKQLFGVW